MTAADAAVPTSLSLDAWLDRLARATGAPGGGAACGVMIAISASLLHMVAGYSAADERAVAAGERAITLRGEALAGAEADGIRSAELGAALAAPDTASTRDADVRQAALAAAASSAGLGKIARGLAAELRLLADIGNANLAADVAVAARALEAGLGGALVNLRANIELARAHREPEDGADDELTRLADEGAQMSADVGTLATPTA